jgi:2-phosphosulfolactate phosphatase
MPYSQDRFDLRCEWGSRGLRAILPGCEAVIIVDVLSFCTAVDVAVSRGGIVYPAASVSAGKEIAAREGASLARSRKPQTFLSTSDGKPLAQGGLSLVRTGFSLSPQSMLHVSFGERIVLPSPNGSRLSLETYDVPTFAGCFRNAGAVAAAAMRIAKRIGVIAAGERWPDGSLRPAIEDWLGAGAILSHLEGTSSPDAQAAIAAFRETRTSLQDAISRSASGCELMRRRHVSDVTAASAYQVSVSVPRLIEGAYVDCPEPPPPGGSRA